MKTSALLLISACIAALLAIAPAFGQNSAPAGMPDVLIWVDARTVGACAVSITYPKVISKAQAEADLARLLQETGWGAASVNVTEGSIMKSGEFPMTSVEFMTPAVTQSLGVLPIEPIVKAFRNMRKIEVQYLTLPTFYFSGYGDFENKYVKITLNRGNNSYRYSIQVKDAEFNDLGLPKPAAQGTPGDTAVEHRPSITLVVTILIVMLALMTAILAYILTARYTRPGGQVRRS